MPTLGLFVVLLLVAASSTTGFEEKLMLEKSLRHKAPLVLGDSIAKDTPESVDWTSGGKCMDKEPECEYWASIGECGHTATRMRKQCCQACKRWAERKDGSGGTAGSCVDNEGGPARCQTVANGLEPGCLDCGAVDQSICFAHGRNSRGGPWNCVPKGSDCRYCQKAWGGKVSCPDGITHKGFLLQDRNGRLICHAWSNKLVANGLVACSEEGYMPKSAVRCSKSCEAACIYQVYGGEKTKLPEMHRSN